MERCLQSQSLQSKITAMKTLIRMFIILGVFTLSILATTKNSTAQAHISFQVFYDQLSPYGSWVSYPNYGYVWLPNAGPGFSPYATAGHWVFTEFGWTWVSDYSWGWAAFHYGRWMYDPFYGWLWVPDTVWGPAWVVWRSSPGYYGWAPLRPGISINVAFGPGYYIPNDWWVFTPCNHINRRDVYNYYAPRSSNVTIINNTTIINRTYVDEREHTTYSYGPDRESVQRATGLNIKPVKINHRDSPGESMSNDQLSIYRPRIQKTYANGTAPVPKDVKDITEVKKKRATASETKPNAITAPATTKQSAPIKQAPVQNNVVKPEDNKSKQKVPAETRPKENSQPKQGNTQMHTLQSKQAHLTAPEKSILAAPKQQSVVLPENKTAISNKSNTALPVVKSKAEKIDITNTRKNSVVTIEKRELATGRRSYQE
jgi:hypothetical protein